MSIKEKVILGIDPGTNVMGYGLLLSDGNKMSMMNCGIIQLGKIGDHMEKLHRIYERCIFLIDEYKPLELAIEAPFHGKNVQSMLKLGRAQGTAIAAALSRNLPIFEYAPKKIKMSITGNGNSSKQQVALMLQQLLAMKDIPKYLDATDGLAAAVCHHFQKNNGITASKGKGSGWKSFISNNPGRIL